MPLLWLSIAFIAGILLGKWLPQPGFVWGLLALFSCAWFVVDRLKKHHWWRKLTPVVSRFNSDLPGAGWVEIPTQPTCRDRKHACLV